MDDGELENDARFVKGSMAFNFGFSDCSSVDSSPISSLSNESRNSLNLKETELRLGLPGSESPEREEFDVKALFPLHPSKDTSNISGIKRGYCETRWTESESSANLKEVSRRPTESRPAMANQNNSKAQVVGWPPIRSFRKNTMATSSKNAEEVDGKTCSGALFVKVSMDGAPYLRKIDLRSYTSYRKLSSALEKMFNCLTIGQYGSHGSSSGSEYVLTYEDRDGDWMLVGDVPWEMFIDSCKKVKIMKNSDAIGLAPRALAKCNGTV